MTSISTRVSSADPGRMASAHGLRTTAPPPWMVKRVSGASAPLSRKPACRDAPGLAQRRPLPAGLEGGAHAACPLVDGGAHRAVPEHQLEALQPRHPLRARPRPAAIPDVGGELMMVAARAEEAAARIAARHLEAEQVAVEAHRPRQVAGGQDREDFLEHRPLLVMTVAAVRTPRPRGRTAPPILSRWRTAPGPRAAWPPRRGRCGRSGRRRRR
jgi:hypothetical protein